MERTTSTAAKGKERAIDTPEEILLEDTNTEDTSSSESSETESGSDSDSDSDTASPEYLESLLQKAKASLRAKAAEKKADDNEEFMSLGGIDGDVSQLPLPALDPGASLPPPYFDLGGSKKDTPKLARDPDGEATVAQASSSKAFVAPELKRAKEPLTNREKKALKNATAGPSWFDLPAPAPEDLPRLYREVEALRLRNQLDPKRFYRRDEGEGKGIKGLPKYFAVGKIVDTPTPFEKATSSNLTCAERKRTIVEELVDDAEARSYAKRKYEDLQRVRGERGRGTLRKKMEGRKPKW